MSFSVTDQAIDAEAVRAACQDDRCGGYVAFEGWVRNHNEGRSVDRLAYEVYEPVAIAEGNKVIEEARARWGFEKAVCIHRSGQLELTDMAVIVGVSSPHRDEAFQAARYIIDEIKVRLPIWKKEYYSDGDAEWVNCQRCGHAHSHDKPDAVARQA